MDKLIKEFLQRTENTKAENTYNTYCYHMKYWFPNQHLDLTPAYVDRKIGEWRKAGTSINTIYARLRTLNQFLNFITIKEIEIPGYKELQAIISSVEQQDKIPTIATRDQVDAVIEKCKDLKYKSIISLLFFGGLRVSEAVGLDLADFNAANGEIIVRDPKNKKERIVRLEDRTVALLKKYIEHDREDTSEAMFNTAHGRISQNVVQRQVTKHSQKAGFDLNCHAFRHGSATYLLENGIDLRVIQHFLGHKSITTTQRYTHITDARKDDVKNAFARR